MKRNLLIVITTALALVLCLLLCLDRLLDARMAAPTEPSWAPTASEPTVAHTQGPTETQPTEPAPTQAQPTEPLPTQTAPPTEPPQTKPKDEYIGTLYTRGELEAMENQNKGYGPGSTSGGKRPPYAPGDQKKYEKYGANFIAPDNGKIYLTFDCGYEYQNLTASILDTLKEKNVKAVFFVTMPYVKQNPELVQRMIDEGHTVGNHSNTHPEMPSLSIDQMVWEVTSLHEYVKEHFGYEMKLFRPPTGAFSTRSLAVVQSLGYKTVHWSFAYADWDTDKQPQEAAALEKITSSHHSGAIYLLHAVSRTNAAVLGDAIDFFLTSGYVLDLFA